MTWYTWLEQGRPINVSTQVVEAVGRALRLDRFEQAHLSTLSGLPTSPAEAKCAALTPQTSLLLAKLSPYPARVVNERLDLLRYNDAYRRLLIDDLDDLPVADRNTMWLYFTHPQWRAGMVGADAGPGMVASFRAAMAHHLGDPAWQHLLDRLTASSQQFADLWAKHDIAGTRAHVKVIQSPCAGLLRLESTNLWVSQRGGTRLVVYSPVDDETAARLDRFVR